MEADRKYIYVKFYGISNSSHLRSRLSGKNFGYISGMAFGNPGIYCSFGPEFPYAFEIQESARPFKINVESKFFTPGPNTQVDAATVKVMKFRRMAWLKLRCFDRACLGLGFVRF